MHNIFERLEIKQFFGEHVPLDSWAFSACSVQIPSFITLAMPQFDVIALRETWLDSSVSSHELLPSGYAISRRDRENKRGGGVILAVKDTIKSDQFKFNSTSLEIVGTVINSLFNKVLVCLCYRLPNAGPEFLQEFIRFLKCANES